jgi:phosphopantothenoylcysteine decarboxylase/phosphopantothenate--cysteine ligase
MAREALGRAAEVDLVLMAAAVADYRPARALGGNRPKDDQVWTVQLEPTEDVQRALGERRRPGQVLVGFAADRGEQGLARAREKLASKRVDAIVFNDVARTDVGFDVEDNEVLIVGRDGERAVPKSSKARVAAAIVDEAVRLLALISAPA